MSVSRGYLSSLRAILWRVLHFFARISRSRPLMLVLLYHSVSESRDFFAVSPKDFERQMSFLKKHFRVVPLSRAFEHAAGDPVRENSVAITFDDGYKDFATTALPILRVYGFPSTVFVLGGEPSEDGLGNSHPLLSPADISSLGGQPDVSVGSHSLTHRKLTRLSEDDLRRELEGSAHAIQGFTGIRPRYVAYPKGSFNTLVAREAQALGYEGAVSVIERGVHPGDPLYALPRIQVDSSTTESIFSAKLSRAADWYYFLWGLVRRGGAK